MIINTHDGTHTASGINVVLSSDDPGIFGYTGLSNDFFITVLASQLDLKAIKQLVFNSINYSSLSDKEKFESLGMLQSSWDTWVVDSIDKYAEA